MDIHPLWYIVILGVVAIVYAAMLPRQQTKAVGHNEVVREVEDTLEHFMNEIESDNEELMQLVRQLKQDVAVKQDVLQHRVEQLEQRCQKLELELQQSSLLPASTLPEQQKPLARDHEVLLVPEEISQAIKNVSEERAEFKEEPMPEAAVEDYSLKGRYAELFALYDEGKSIDYISRKIGIHRGEVQLILQLAKQEETRV